MTPSSARQEWQRAAVSVAKSGVLKPGSVRALSGVAAAAWRHGATVSTLFAVSAARYPERTAVIDDGGAITYDELYRSITALAHQLRTDRRGAPRSVAVLCRNHRGFVIGVAAAGHLGAEIISINTELPGAQLAAILERHQPDVLLHDGEYVDAVLSSGYTGRGICVDAPEGGADPSFASMLTAGPTRIRRQWRAGKLTLLTSGTTGLAKGVPRSIKPGGVAQLAASGAARIGFRSDDVIFVGPPFFHGFGIAALLGGMALGATVVCHRRFDPSVAAHDLTRHRVTTLYAVPAMLQRLLNDPGARRAAERHSLRVAVTGAAPITSSTVSRFHELFGPVLVNGYGSTEAGVVSIATSEDLLDAPATLGTATLGVSIRITDDRGNPLPTGTTGRILVRGPLEYTGYTPDAKSAVTSKLVVDQHVDTGDLGHVDQRGRLFLAGRSDDMIVSGGENVFPTEVEDVVTSHASVSDAVVVGVDDDDFGQVLHAYVVLAGNAEPDDDALKGHVRQHLERYKVPKQFIYIDEVPRNPSGKVLRRELLSADRRISNGDTN